MATSPDNQRVYRDKADSSEEFYLYDGSGRVETFRMDKSGTDYEFSSPIFPKGGQVYRS